MHNTRFYRYIYNFLSYNSILVDFLLSHVELLRNPIIFGERNCMVGYNDVEIRRFFPKEYRHLHF